MRAPDYTDVTGRVPVRNAHGEVVGHLWKLDRSASVCGRRTYDDMDETLDVDPGKVTNCGACDHAVATRKVG